MGTLITVLDISQLHVPVGRRPRRTVVVVDLDRLNDNGRNGLLIDLAQFLAIELGPIGSYPSWDIPRLAPVIVLKPLDCIGHLHHRSQHHFNDVPLHKVILHAHCIGQGLRLLAYRNIIDILATNLHPEGRNGQPRHRSNAPYPQGHLQGRSLVSRGWHREK